MALLGSSRMNADEQEGKFHVSVEGVETIDTLLLLK